jgi:hypothetical protein
VIRNILMLNFHFFLDFSYFSIILLKYKSKYQ